MIAQLRPALVILSFLALVTGAVYPAVVTITGDVLFHRKAAGSVIDHDGEPVGSGLIGQPFADARYFWPRPSATTPAPYNASSSSGSNLAPSNPALVKAVADRVEVLKAAHPNAGPVPIDFVTTSASGLDPHISPAAAEYQVQRVANARGMARDTVRTVVNAATEGRTFGVLGEPRVNVLKLNLALDGTAPR